MVDTMALPPDTVRFYNDGPDWPTSPLLMDAERAYRSAFVAGAREVADWDMPDEDAIETTWEERRAAYRSAEVFDSEQILFRVGHEVAASRTRGRCHALEFAKQHWWNLGDAGTPDAVIVAILHRWIEQVEVWGDSPIDPQFISTPPRPEELLTDKQNRMCKAIPPWKQTESVGPHSLTRRLIEVEREQLDWLWPGRIPLGKLTLLAGDPGLGKSFVTLDLAARVSRGAPWPDLPLLKQTPADVLLFNAEDDLADTIAPRLDKAEADSNNIVAFEGVSVGGKRRHFSLEVDLPRLIEVLAENPNTRLIVIDPISAYTGKVDSHKNTEVRGLLAPLADLASAHRIAIVAVTHLSKSGGGKAVYRAMGSLAFAAASRAVWAIVKDSDDPQRRMFLPAKLNLAQDPDGLAYRIIDGRVQWDVDPVRMHADDAFAEEMRAANGGKRRGSEGREAAEWLRKELASGPKPASEVIELGEQYAFSKRTLQRALKTIDGERTKNGFDGPWMWSLLCEDASEDAKSPPLL